MPYMVDGHNLIPKIAGLSLSDPDDELQLIQLLQEFCRRKGKQVEVFFDQAPAGQKPARKFGQVNAYFVRQGRTADDAIRARLVRLGRASRNWTVVSSDRMVQAAAHEAGAQTLTAESFAGQIAEALQGERSAPNKPEADLSPDELAGWLELFRPGKKGKGRQK